MNIQSNNTILNGQRFSTVDRAQSAVKEFSPRGGVLSARNITRQSRTILAGAKATSSIGRKNGKNRHRRIGTAITSSRQQALQSDITESTCVTNIVVRKRAPTAEQADKVDECLETYRQQEFDHDQ